MESFWANLKREVIYLVKTKLWEKNQMIKEIKKYISYYNHFRKIKVNNYLAPRLKFKGTFGIAF